MKTLLFTALWLCAIAELRAQNTTTMATKQTDSSAISQLVEDIYLKSLYTGDAALLGSIFHPESLLFGDIHGEPYAKTLDQYLTGVSSRQSPKDSGQPFHGEVISVKVVNSIAVAEVQVTMYTFIYHDFLSFHRIDGQWLIVNKMLTAIND
jgi:hypothetical protein